MTLRRSLTRIALASLSLAGACTNDFSGYHLEADASGGDSAARGGDVSVGSGTSSGGDDASAGEPSHEGGDAGASSGGRGGRGNAGTSSGGSNSTTGGSAVMQGEAGSGGDAPSAPPSCAGLAETCGADGNASCCAASLVPGGSYDRSNLKTAPATLSDFTLEDYEVTVGRFRQFVGVFTRTIVPAGAGKNPHDMNDTGWNSAWNTALPATAAALTTALSCGGGSTFTAAAGANENLPVTCVNWFEAYAFCAWDGGRLPTEAEWNYAAAGGAEERTYPWGSTAPTDSEAVFCPASCSKIQSVGSRVAGNGKWGQADLVGNAWEWNADSYANPYPASCTDCASESAATSAARIPRWQRWQRRDVLAVRVALQSRSERAQRLCRAPLRALERVPLPPQARAAARAARADGEVTLRVWRRCRFDAALARPALLRVDLREGLLGFEISSAAPPLLFERLDRLRSATPSPLTPAVAAPTSRAML